MSSDPYWEWLRVRPGRRPPNHFELLGLTIDIEDAALIDQAARQQARRIKERQSGPNGDQCAILMQEIARARAVLLDPAKRAAYRASIANHAADPWWKDGAAPVASDSPASTPQASVPSDAGEFFVDESGHGEESIVQLQGKYRASKGPRTGLFVVAAIAVIALIGGGIGMLVVFNSPASKTEHANQQPISAEKKEKSKPTNVQDRDPISAQSPFVSELELPPTGSAPPTNPTSFVRHSGLVQSLAISPRGKRFLSAGVGGAIEWDLGTGKSFLRTAFNGVSIGAVYLSEGKQIACADEGSILIMEVGNNEIKATLKNPRGNLRCIAANREGTQIFSAGTDGTVRRWSAATKQVDRVMEAGDSVQFTCLAVAPDARIVAAGGTDGTLGLWDVASGKRLWQHKNHSAAVAGVAIDPDGTKIATASLDGSIGIWSTEGGAKLGQISAHRDGSLVVAFLSDGSGLVSGGSDKTLKFWRLDSKFSLRTLSIPAAAQAAAIVADGKSLLIAGGGGMVRRIPIPDLDLDAIVRVEPPTAKLVEPGSSDVEKELSAIATRYHDQLDGLDADELHGFAERCLARAQAEAKPAQRMAWFRKALAVFTQQGKLKTTFDAITILDRWFEIDLLLESAHALSALANSSPASEQIDLVTRGLKLAREADATDRAETGDEILAALAVSSKKLAPSDRHVADRITKAKERHQRRVHDSSRLKEMDAKLKADPNDHDANFGSGVILCNRNQWNDGLGRISKSGDASMVALARRDLADPKDGKSQAELGRGWADAAGKQAEMKIACLMRAKHWFESAQANLTGEEKSRVVLKLGDVSAQLSALTPDDKDAAAIPEKSAPKPKLVTRRNYNTIGTKAVAKSDWTATGEVRWEPSGYRFLAGSPRIESSFELADNWRIDIAIDQDGRGLKIEVNNQTISVEPAVAATIVAIERKGNRIVYATSRQSKPVGQSTTIELTEINQQPSHLRISLSEKAKSAEGASLRAVLLTGTIKADE